MNAKFKFELRGKTIVLVDWSNIYHQLRNSDWEIDALKLFEYLKSEYSIDDLVLFAGKDKHPKSKKFLQDCKDLGYEIISKPVKYMQGKRKCDFDVEITMKALDELENFKTFIVLSGDGDFAPIIQRLLDKHKKVFVLSAYRCLGKEISHMRTFPIYPIIVRLNYLRKTCGKEKFPAKPSKC